MLSPSYVHHSRLRPHLHKLLFSVRDPFAQPASINTRLKLNCNWLELIMSKTIPKVWSPWMERNANVLNVLNILRSIYLTRNTLTYVFLLHATKMLHFSPTLNGNCFLIRTSQKIGIANWRQKFTDKCGTHFQWNADRPTLFGSS
jgi:hypothetical protein